MIYYGMFFFHIFLTFFKKNKLLLFLSFILIWFISGFRYNLPTDYKAYFNYFKIINSFWQCESIFQELKKYNIENGYIFLMMFVKSFTNNFNIFLFITHFFTTLLFFIGIRKVNYNYTFLAVIIYLNRTFFGLLEANRQLIAIMILFASFNFYLEGKKKIFFLIAVPSMLFHETAIFMLILFLILDKKISLKIQILLFLIFTFFYIGNIGIGKNIIDIFKRLLTDFSFRKVEWYLNFDKSIANSYGIAFFFQNFLLNIYLIFLKYKGKVKTKEETIIFNLLFYFFVFKVIFHDFPIMDYRISYYFDVFNCFCYPYILIKSGIRKIFLKKAILVVWFSLSFLTYTRSPNFIRAFIPYQNIFMQKEKNEAFTFISQ